jgi:hypothetical protein
MTNIQILKSAALAAAVVAFMAGQGVRAGGSDNTKKAVPCPPPIVICNPPPQGGHNYCNPTPHCETSLTSGNLFQTSVILLLTQTK